MRSYKSPMLTPSPLRRKALRPVDSDTSVDGELGLETPIDAEDIFGGSPYRATAPLRSFDAHLRSSARFGGMDEDEEDDDDDERVFLSTPARHSTPGRPKRGTSTARLRTPVNSHQRPRPHSTVEPTPLPAAFAASARTPARRTPLRVNTQTTTTGIKRKSTELNFQASPKPPKGALTPLSVTRPGGESSFDRLAPLPLPAPKFKRRDEPELFLGRTGTMDGLRIGLDVDDEPIDVSPDGHVAKRRAKSRPVSQDLGGTVAFPSAAVARERTLSNESSSSNHNSVRPPRQRLSHASNVSTRSRTKSGAQGLSRAQTIAAATPGRPIARRLESNGSATLFFGPPIVRSSTPARRHRSPAPTESAQRQFARHSYAGPEASPVPFGPGRSSSPSLPDDEPMGEISDEDAARSMPDVSMIASMEDEDLDGMDEEDLFFASSSFRSDRGDEGTGADSSADDSFGWGSAPAHASTFSINVTASTPSPRKAVKAMLEKKFKPRDSGIGLTDDEDNTSTPNFLAGLRAPAATAARGFGIGRSGSVSIMAPPPMVPSSSASTTGSSDLEALVTPGFGPSASSGWPSFASSSTLPSSDLLSLLSADSENAMDTFIARTLASAQAPTLPGAGAEPKRAAPGTPQKRARAQDRAWHSAFATGKVGFDYSVDEAEVEGAEEEGGKKKKKPRKSLPAAFPSLSMGMGKAKPKLTLPGVRKAVNSGARVGESDLDSDSESPGKRSVSGKYAGIGLGRPQRPGAAWLLRRSSSGAISTNSGESSWPNTPTAATAGGKSGWQLPPPRIPPASPATQPRLPSRLSPASTRTASSSSTSTATASPLGSRLLQISQPRLGTSPLKSSTNTTHNNQRTTTLPPPITVTKTNVRRAGRPSLPAMPLSSDARPGRFEAEFVEAGEIGSGEFGKVMRVKMKVPTGCEEENEWAVKRSKRFEGARHRLRVREEVDVLQHLRRAYLAQGHGKWHPNVLGIVDAWEEDEALFIRTELCSLGSFSRFLWEFGRRFERLDEGRVWKIAADLSSGLSFVHACGVLHLDLKPANIFLTSEGRFKLGDFGMATLWPRAGTPAPVAGEGAERPPGFEREGDKCYLAPEVLQGRYGPAADIFSLGITMLETAANIVVPDQGEQWHRLRQDDLSGVDLAGFSNELVHLLSALLRSDPFARPDAGSVAEHPVVRRARDAMERAGPGAGSPLAPCPAGFLAQILDDGEEDVDEEMAG